MAFAFAPFKFVGVQESFHWRYGVWCRNFHVSTTLLSPSRVTIFLVLNCDRATFDLNLDPNYDIPLAVTIEGTVLLRAHLFINGYKFGRYSNPHNCLSSPILSTNSYTVQNLGPQTVFPIPEGIMNHQDTNTIAIILWNLNADGGYLTNLTLGATGAYLKGYGSVTASPQPAYSFRPNAF
jgi:hypothetical protein